MKSKHKTTVIMLCLILLTIPLQASSLCTYRTYTSNEEHFIYYMKCLYNGTLIVNITFISKTNKEVRFSIYLPRKDIVLNYKEYIDFIVVEKKVRKSENYFYNIVTYICKPLKKHVKYSVSYKFLYGALIIKSHVFFMSPLIKHEPEKGCAVLILEFGILGFVEEHPVPYKVEYKGNRTILYYKWSVPPERIYFYSRLKGVSEKLILIKVHGAPIRIHVPERYLSEGTHIAKIYEQAYPILTEIFGVSFKSTVDVYFFLPRGEVFFGVVGFVPFKLTKGSEREIHLNLLYLRGIPGTLEYGSIHELIHHFLLKLGVSPVKLLWVHEGLAEYLGMRVTEIIDKQGKYEPGIRERRKMLEKEALKTNGKYGIVQSWSPYYCPTESITVCYGCSYMIFKTLCEKYGNLNLLKKFFRYLKDYSRNGTITSTMVIIEALSKAAGKDLTATFAKWGFKVILPGKVELLKVKVERELSFKVNIFRGVLKRRYEKANEDIKRHDIEEGYEELISILVLSKLGQILTLIIIYVLIALLLVLAYVRVKSKHVRALLKEEYIIKESTKIV